MALYRGSAHGIAKRAQQQHSKIGLLVLLANMNYGTVSMGDQISRAFCQNSEIFPYFTSTPFDYLYNIMGDKLRSRS